VEYRNTGPCIESLSFEFENGVVSPPKGTYKEVAT